MSIRLRLLLAAAGIVFVSLFLSGALALVLVRSLEIDSAQLDLDRQAFAAQQVALRATCQTPPAVPNAGCPGGRLADVVTYEDRIAALVPGTAERILLVAPPDVVAYDTEGFGTYGLKVKLVRTRQVGSGVASEGTIALAGQTYLAAGASIAGRRNPLLATHVVVVRSMSTLNGQAVSQLLPPFLEAALLALVVALTLALVLSRAVAGPLTELAAAAQDIAAGNYSRRVRIGGGDEIKQVGRSFNRMGEAVERARTLQRDFLANVSHELKTPLTSLIGFSQAMLDGSLAGEVERARAALIIHEEAERVLRMSQELLDLARVESGQMPIHLGQVDLHALLEQEVELVRPRAAGRSLPIELASPNGLAPVHSDLERLRQVVANLLDNAVKYADPAEPVRVGVASVAGGAEVTVANRVGTHPPDPDRMFERFYRADSSRPSSGGVGLGLAISRELVVLLGGRLTAELEGTELRLRLSLPAAGPG